MRGQGEVEALRADTPQTSPRYDCLSTEELCMLWLENLPEIDFLPVVEETRGTMIAMLETM